MGDSAVGLTVLITNMRMDWPSGTVVYVRDLALELQRLGHRPIVYTWLNGKIGYGLKASGIQVVDDLWQIKTNPDVIHGHHRSPIRGALLRFPGVPAIAFCHNPTDPWDAPAPDPAIRRYFGVSELCAERLRSVGAPPEEVSVRPNFVDLRRFVPRGPLPPKPTRALVFSNYATPETHLPAVQEAAARMGLPLDVVGRGVGRATDHPEEILANYDLVFAVGKAALEAMAVGAAVVLCDRAGLGPMVTAENFAGLRRRNLGLAALTNPVTPEGIAREAGFYDPEDASQVRVLVRDTCGLEPAVAGLVEVYRRVIAEAAASGVPRPHRTRIASTRYRALKAPVVTFYRVFGTGPRRVPTPIKPVYRLARAMMRRALGIR